MDGVHFMATERALLLHGFYTCESIQPQSIVLMKEIELSTYTFIFLFPKQQPPSHPGTCLVLGYSRDDIVCTEDS